MTAIECKFNSDSDDSLASGISSISKNFEAFRELYPDGENLVVSHNIDTPFTRKYKNLMITFVNTRDLVKKLTAK